MSVLSKHPKEEIKAKWNKHLRWLESLDHIGEQQKVTRVQ